MESFKLDKNNYYSKLDYSHVITDWIILNTKMKVLFISYPRAMEKARQYFI